MAKQLVAGADPLAFDLLGCRAQALQVLDVVKLIHKAQPTNNA